jgi:hypothetical protein
MAIPSDAKGESTSMLRTLVCLVNKSSRGNLKTLMAAAREFFMVLVRKFQSPPVVA